jgi:hypothetical protein
MTQIDSMSYRVEKADHDRAVALFKDMLDYQRSHPELYHYTRSRTFFMDAPDNPDQEVWMFIDEYDDREKYWASLMNAAQNDPQSAENRRRWAEIVVQPPPTGHDVWTELDELRVEF